jgi:hypothetical protein
VKWPGREADHKPSSSAEVKHAFCYTSTSPYAFMAWYSFQHRLNFTSPSPPRPRSSGPRSVRVVVNKICTLYFCESNPGHPVCKWLVFKTSLTKWGKEPKQWDVYSTLKTWRKGALVRPRHRWKNIMDLGGVGGKMWTGFVGLRLGTSGGLLWVQWWSFGFLKWMVIPELTEWLHLKQDSAPLRWLFSWLVMNK